MIGDCTIGLADFDKFRAALPRRFGDSVVSAWMCDLKLEERTEDQVILSTGTQLRCDTLGQRFILMMRETWSEEVAPIKRLRVVRRQIEDAVRRVEQLSLKPARLDAPIAKRVGAAQGDLPAQATIEESPVDDRQTFETFAVDESNATAVSAVRQIFTEDGRDVVYIYGPSGVGKTHLLFSAANEWRRLHGANSCAYFAYNALRNGCSNAAMSNGISALHRELKTREAIFIDDIHLLVSATRTQTELLDLLKAAPADRRRVVIAGEVSPQQLAEAGINKRLADRLAEGLSVDLLPGDAAHRARVIRKRIESLKPKCAFNDDAVAYIAEKFSNSLREALGAFNQLHLIHGGKDMEVGRPEAERALKSRVVVVKRNPTLDEAAAAAATAFNISFDDLKGRRQHQSVARARHAFVIVARESLRESFPRIANTLGRDHTTAMSGFKRGQALLERDRKFADQIAAIRETLGCTDA